MWYYEEDLARQIGQYIVEGEADTCTDQPSASTCTMDLVSDVLVDKSLISMFCINILNRKGPKSSDWQCAVFSSDLVPLQHVLGSVSSVRNIFVLAAWE